MVANGYYTQCGHHIARYINVESLSYTPETNTIFLCQLYIKNKSYPEKTVFPECAFSIDTNEQDLDLEQPFPHWLNRCELY